MEPHRQYRTRAGLLIGTGILAAAAVFALGGQGGGTRSGALERPTLVVPDGPRVIAEVLNGAGLAGLARAGTALLRREGIDVVYFGNGPATDSTLILVRRGDPDAGTQVARALGLGIVRTERDTLLRVDVTVLLGHDFTPPPALRP